jgi:hypothetical protein
MTPISRRLTRFLLGLIFPALLGCGGSTTVTGTVSYDGKKMERGKITFMPTDDKSVAVGCDIIQGKYTAHEVPRGKKKVYITALDDEPAEMSSRLIDNLPATERRLKPPLLPPEATKDLTADITQTGEQTVDFNLPKVEPPQNASPPK